MTWKRKRRKWNWRAFLTADEASLIRASERQAEQIEKMQKEWNERWHDRRSLIVNRAIQRAKYDAATGDRRDG